MTAIVDVRLMKAYLYAACVMLCPYRIVFILASCAPPALADISKVFFCG